MAARKPSRQGNKGAQTVKAIDWVAPTKGWRTDVPLAELPPDAAAQLTNWFPETSFVRARNGSNTWATTLTGTVGTLSPYSGATNKLFAWTASALYEVTSAGAGSAVGGVTTTNNHWSTPQFTNAGGKWLVCCNGTDTPKLYDGTNWTNFAGTGGPTLTTLSVCAVYRSRLWFLQKNTTTLWYMGTDAVSGAFGGSVNVGNVMKYGGTLIAMNSWTAQVQSGVLQFLVLMSSEGELIVYQGSNPADSTNWSLLGTFKLGFPLGLDRCLFQVGADLAVMTVDGIVPISQAIQLSPAAADQASLTKNIAPTWLSTTRTIGAAQVGWELCVHPSARMAIINIPDPASGTYQYVMNTETMAWCNFTGWAATCWASWEGNLYFGTASGTVVQADAGSADNSIPIDCLSVGGWTRLSDGLAPKMTTTIGVDAILDQNAAIYAGVSFDYVATRPKQLTSSSSGATVPIWDTALWDTALWTGPAPKRLIANAGGEGVVFAPTVRALISGSSSSLTNCQLIGGALHVQQGMGF